MEGTNTVTNIGTRIAVQAASQTVNGGIHFHQSANESQPYPTSLLSDAVYLPDHFLLRAEIHEFLLNAQQSHGKCRTVLYGLPGVGKTAMMRHFAHTMKTEKYVLWISATSGDDIRASFWKYAQQLGARSLNITDPASFIAEKIDERATDFLIIFDGLDNPSIDPGPYLFSDKTNVRTFITTRRRQLGSEIGATHEMQVISLDDHAAEDLLITMMSTPSMTDAKVDALPSDGSTVLRKIVQSLGGLPLAISIVGRYLRGSLSIVRQNCLSQFSEQSHGLFGPTGLFPYHPNPVWETFEMAFHKLLNSEDEPWTSARSMAYFIASLHETSALNDWIRICHRASSSTHFRPGFSSDFVDALGFLENGNKFVLSFQMLTDVNLVIFDPAYDRRGQLPPIEMHSLVRDWLRSKSRIQPDQYIGARLRLLGFAIYDDLSPTQALTGRYDLLATELLQRVTEVKIIHGGGLVHSGNPETSFPFLVRVIDRFRTALDYLQPETERYQRQFQAVSDELVSQMYDYFVDELWHIDWDTVFDKFTDEAEQQVELALQEYRGVQSYDLVKFFTEALDENDSLLAAFDMVAPRSLQSFSQVALIASIKQQVTYELRRLTKDDRNEEAFQQAKNILCGSEEEARDLIVNWRRDWTKDVVTMIRASFRQVVRRLIHELASRDDGMPSQSSLGTSHSTAQGRETHSSYEPSPRIPLL